MAKLTPIPTNHSRGKSSLEDSNMSNTNRVVPPPINIPTRRHKSILKDDFEKGREQITKLDYYEEIRRKPIKLLMTREISQHYGREIYLKTTIKEIIIYVIFLLVLAILILHTPASDMNMFTTSMAEIFTKPGFKTGKDSEIELLYKDINTIEDVWLYLDNLVTSFENYLFFSIPSDDGNKDTSGGLQENQLIGLPRIRTVRVKNDSCKIAEQVRNDFTRTACYGHFSSSAEDTLPFTFSNGSTWNYSSSEETGLHSVYGQVSTYSGGGLFWDCPKTGAGFRDMLSVLKSEKCIDQATRALIVDFTVYNANINLFCIVKLLFEMPPTGGVIPSFIIHTLKIIEFGSENIVFFVCTILFIAIFVFYTIEEMYEMTYFKWEFINSFWNLLDIAIVMMCYTVIISNLFQYKTVDSELTAMVDNDSQFANFDQMLYVQIVCNIATALLVFFCWLKILKYTNINHSMSQLQATLQLALKDMMWFSMIFLLAFFTFAFVGSVLFGKQLENYYTFRNAVWTILRAGVGDFNYLELAKSSPILGPLFFLLALYFLCCVLVGVYIAILLDRYAEVRSEIHTGSVQMKIGDVMQTWIVDIIGSFSHRLAIKARESFNRTKMKNKFQDVRYLLMRCGFTELEINMFLAKYEISEDRIMTEEDLRNITMNFQSEGKPGLGLAKEMVRHSVGEKLTVMEEAISNAERKTTLVLSILENLEIKLAATKVT